MGEVVVTAVQSGRRPRQSRYLEERLMVRFPGLYRRLAASAFERLAPGSRLRRVLLRRQVASGWSAYNRRDFELMLVRYASNVEFEFPPGQQTLGLSGTFRGHEAMAGALREQIGGWGAAEIDPAYVVDLGDRALVLGIMRVRGDASGVQLEQELAQLLTLRKGLVERDQARFRWADALQATGLNPETVSLPRRGPPRGAVTRAE